MNKLRIINELKRTVGYNESDDKTEYLKGAGMAIDKCMAEYTEVVSGKNRTIDNQDTQLSKVKQTIGEFDALLRSSREQE